MVLRSSPMVSMTRLPHNHRPSEMPSPPYANNQMGVAASVTKSPDVAINQILTKGPMPLLYGSKGEKISFFYDNICYTYN